MQRNSPHRFSSSNRMPDAASFARVFEKATRSRDRWFTVLCRDNDLGTARLGLAVSKKHCKKAVARNRIKRIIRESFRGRKETLPGLDIVVMNQASTSMATNSEMFASLEKHWQRCTDQQKNKAGSN